MTTPDPLKGAGNRLPKGGNHGDTMRNHTSGFCHRMGETPDIEKGRPTTGRPLFHDSEAP